MASTQKLILVVDDEVNLLVLVKKILEDEGYTVDIASNGNDGLGKLKHIKPDLVILDIMMPDSSGMDVLRKIREHKNMQDIKVVFLTALDQKKIKEEQLEALDVADYITKPFAIADLVERINKVLS